MSKLSLHISNWLDAEDTYDFIGATQPPVVKVFSDGGLDDFKIREGRSRSPGTLWVGRQYFPDQVWDHFDDSYPGNAIEDYDPKADALNVFNQMQANIAKFSGLIDVWEGYNEVPIDSDEPLTERNRQKARRYSAFTAELAQLMHDARQKFAGYSFSTGNPVHVELWDLLLDGLRASDYLALHEYIAPNQEWNDFYFGMCNRYREIYARVPQEAQRPIIITECGDDYRGEQGYRGEISNDQYLDHLKTYDGKLMQDPYVVGAVIFCYGINSPQWKSYDVGGDFAKRLKEYVASTPTPPVAIKPTEPAEKEPAKPQEPAREGETIYIILPGDTLGAIAKRFKVTLAALVAVNQIANPNRIRAGQRLLIPAPGMGIAGMVAARVTKRVRRVAAQAKRVRAVKKKLAARKKKK